MSSTETEQLECALPLAPGIGRSVLLVDDDPIQLRLMRAHLAAAGFAVRIAGGASEALELARQERPDAIVSDVRMSELDGFMLCSLFRCDPQLGAVPIMLVTAHIEGADDHTLALSTGAQTLIERSPNFQRELDTLLALLKLGGASSPTWRPDPCVLRMAKQMGQLLAQSHAAEMRYRTLLENARDAIALLTPDGIILEVNQGCEHILQMPRGAMVGRHIREFAAPGYEDSNVAKYRDSLDKGAQMSAIPIARRDGSSIHMEWSAQAVTISGESLVFCVGRDVTESVQARLNLAASEEKYRTLIESVPDVVWSASLDGRLRFISPRVETICGFAASELMEAPPLYWYERIHPEDLERVWQSFAGLPGSGYAAEYRWQHKDGHWIWIRSNASARVTNDGTQTVEGTFSDITELKRVEEHLVQAQKMEAVGQLTGGIAHDFNNILAVILGNGEFLRNALSESDPRREDAAAILEAGHRGASLTRQLLAFSRRQVLAPRLLDLNRVVRGVEQMLRRIIGEDIELSCKMADSLESVRADAGQIEQVMMNLVVNARDAMPLGGKLFIETANVLLDEEFATTHLLPGPGPYVMLAIGDTGCGMDTETRRRLFEPFFTTKEPGKGTGLGLSTCYGIVKQSEGCIWVYSEPGHGSVFKVYLPVASAEAADRTIEVAAEPPVVSGTETILLVEDDGQVRSTVRRILANLGYEVLEAGDGDEAVRICELKGDAIDLVVCDVIIPGVNGPDIVKRIRSRGGRARALFMSGYTDHAVLRDGILLPDVNFLQKPFAPVTLARKVRDVLEAPCSLP